MVTVVRGEDAGAAQGLGILAASSYPERVGLLEREVELAVLHDAVAGAVDGQGSGVAVSGDAGTGKTSLLESACAAADLRVLRGPCDPLSTPRPLGPFRDLAAALGLRTPRPSDDVSLAETCEDLFEALASTPTALVVEDLHWVDAASVEVLRFLARRIGSAPLALLVSYRADEIGPRHSARGLLGDLARLDGLTTLRLRPLSVAAVERLVEGTGLAADRVHQVTGGNPFFVAEVVKDPDLPLPVSVRDAVLARTLDVAPEDLEVLQLVACAPDRLDDRVLPAVGVDLPTLRRLDATGLLTRARGGLAFRHELARQAVESSVPPGGLPRLHARVLDALEVLEPVDPAVLAHHAVAARDAARAARYAEEAAGEAAAAGSHTEAAAFLSTALDHLDSRDPDLVPVRADLLQRLGFEQYMTSRLEEALENLSATFPLWRRLGDATGLASAYETAAVLEYYRADRRRAETYVDRAAEVADPTVVAWGAVRATRAYLHHMRSEPAQAQACLEQAGEVAQASGDPFLGLRTDLLQSAVALATGDEEARADLAVHIEEARGHGYDELASTGYSHLANLDVEFRRFRSAEHVLVESLPFTVERDIPICRHWQTAVRSRLHFVQGHWSAALEDAGQVLTENGMPLATLWPHLVSALAELRRTGHVAGDAPGEDHLEQAWDLALRLDEPLRRLAVLTALAERCWMTGEADPRVHDLAGTELAAAAGAPATAWAAGELAVWLRRLGLRGSDEAAAVVAAGVAEPFRLSLEGAAADAADWWHRAGEPFAEAMAWSDSEDDAHRGKAVELLDRLGAVATADRLRVDLRRDGIAVVPRPRSATRANPAGLTNRQLDVAKLVARGLTNAEIASRLYISPKTTDHHVSAVLTKLGLPNRRAVVVRADELGLV